MSAKGLFKRDMYSTAKPVLLSLTPPLLQTVVSATALKALNAKMTLQRRKNGALQKPLERQLQKRKH